nr:hypothetical protein [Tanacetum cinerariifolium]
MLKNAPSGLYPCQVCRQRITKGFGYGGGINACSDCCLAEFARKAEADAIKEEATVKLEHIGHPQHTLTLQLRPASFLCDGCKTEEKGLFYQCYSCDFWIHKTCASLAPTIRLPDHYHKHPLVLVYSLPDKFFKYQYYCKFCNKYIRRDEWLYHCANCRYFSHIKCALNAQQHPSTPRDEPSTSAASEDVKNLLHFPMSQAFTDPLKLLHSKNIAQNDKETTEIYHWSHPDHLLILNVEEPQSNNITPNFNSGERIKEDEEFYKCNDCFCFGNTFAYKCEMKCKFYLCVNCAFLPNTIKHESHNHPLTQLIDPNVICNACNMRYLGISYSCKACDFVLGIYCAMRSPLSLAHRYCKGHEIPLTYPPVEDHPEDFYCDICEEEMNPNFPLYHCQKCKYRNSFHLDCISRNDYYANVWSEGTETVSYHKHPSLTFVRRKKTPKYVCSVCNQDINGYLVLECRARTCNFNICFSCHRKKN